jgi:hypothetical protein
MSHGREVLELSGRRKMKYRACGDRLRRQSACGGQTRLDHRLRREQANQAIESQAMNPRDGAASGGDAPHQIVGSLARRCDHQSLGGGFCGREPLARCGDSLRSAMGTDYLKGFTHLSPKIVSHFRSTRSTGLSQLGHGELSATSIGVEAMRRNHYPS